MKNILEYLEATALVLPDKVGFSDNNRELTFTQAMKNAGVLGTALSVYGKRRPIAVLIDRSCCCIEAMLGVLYAGDFYTVVDVHSPVDRIKEIISVLVDPVVLTDESCMEIARQVAGEHQIVVYEQMITGKFDETLLSAIRADMIDMDIAYILFTSGSTGVPKGTVISHRALISYINWVTAEFGFDEKTVFGSQTPLYFSMSVTDLYSTVKCGCTYHIIPKHYFSFPVTLIDYLNDKQINTLYWVPTAISILSNWKAFDVKKPRYLQKVLFAGEVMPTKQLNYWIRNLDEDILYANLFGPTETTDICTFYVLDREFEDSESIPIGIPCDNCQVMIIKEDGTEAGPGEEGELYARTSFMAEGYYNNPEKTRQAFVQNPLHTAYPERVYRTGDLVRRNDAGEIIYISRKDFQIKRNGYRIELGEIEAAANSVDKVKSCACIYLKSCERLVLLYEGGPKDPEKVLFAVKAKVPAYMIPDQILRRKDMPKNANGKIDRKELTRELEEQTGNETKQV